jgi:ABC-type polysaccharide/polyol phosphate export permease
MIRPTMLALNIIFLVCVFTGASIIFYAYRRYRTEKYKPWLKWNPLAIYRVWERKGEFSGNGFRIHVTGVILFSIGTLAAGIKGAINLYHLIR